MLKIKEINPKENLQILVEIWESSVRATHDFLSESEILRIKENLNKILAANTGQKLAKIEKDTDRDFFMSAKEAAEYGLIDKVLEKSFK